MGDSEQKSVPQHIGELVEIAKKKQEECKANFWKLRIGDHEMILRDQAANIINYLTKIGDIAIQFAPPQASIPWSTIKAIMQVRFSCHA